MDAGAKGRIAERAEAATVEGLVGLMRPALAAELGVATRRIGGGLGVRMAAAPDLAYLCRVFALGVDGEVTADVLDESVGFLAEAGGGALLVQVAPFVQTEEVERLLAERGFTRGGTWAKLLRPAADPPTAVTDLRVEEVGREHAEDYGRVQCTGMEMPPFMAPWCAAQVGAPRWRTYAAFDGDDMVAVGSTYRDGDVVQLSGAATLPSHRGRGGQLALMARRMQDARASGAAWVTAETGSETAEEPNPSLHNMVRSGMELLYHRQNWVRRSDAG